MDEERKIEELKWRTRMREERDKYTPRYLRSQQFAETILHLLADFIPSDSDTRYRVQERLMLAAFQSNGALITVPPEWDALNKMALEKAMLEKAMAPIIVPMTDSRN